MEKKSIIWKNHICSSAIMDPFQTPGAKNNAARWKIWYFRTFLCICFFLYDILFKLWDDLEYTPKNGIPFLIYNKVRQQFIDELNNVGIYIRLFVRIISWFYFVFVAWRNYIVYGVATRTARYLPSRQHACFPWRYCDWCFQSRTVVSNEQ